VRLLILRPRPAAERTAERARALGLDPVVAPLFELKPLSWDAPDPAGFEAVMLTSANGAALAGETLASLRHLPCYAVGESSAAAAAEAGFGSVRTGPSDGAALLDRMAKDGVRRAFHPRGRDHVGLSHPDVEIVGRPVYASQALATLPGEAAAAMREGAVALVHSPRSGALLGKLAQDRSRTVIAAISAAAAEAAGSGWAGVAAAQRPRDEALLELAAKLCKYEGGGGGSK
jgi:uroporphyrinogen-III synthase